MQIEYFLSSGSFQSHHMIHTQFNNAENAICLWGDFDNILAVCTTHQLYNTAKHDKLHQCNIYSKLWKKFNNNK